MPWNREQKEMCSKKTYYRHIGDIEECETPVYKRMICMLQHGSVVF